MARVPKKNISPRMTDIRPPKNSKDGGFKDVAGYAGSAPFAPTRPLVRRFAYIFLVCAAGLLALAALLVYGARWYMGAKLARNLGRMEQLLGPGEKTALQKKPAPFGFGDMLNALRHAGELIGSFQGSSNQIMVMMADLQNLERDWPGIFAGNGRAALADLSKLRDSLEVLSRNDAALRSGALQSFLPVDESAFLSLGIDVARAKNFLDDFIPWFSADAERHIAILFLNPAELRPGGGFIGSYGDAVFKNGSLERFEVHDVNDAVTSSSPKIVPPKELQAITLGWHAADSNWFFDFSASAKKFLELMPASTSFDGVVAVSPRIASDILSLTGPIRLADGTALDATNTATLIEADVEQAQAAHAPDPKQILKEAAPLLLKKATSLGNRSGSAFLNLVPAWIAKKDLLVYFKDPTFQSFFDAYGVTGTVFDPPSDFYGDYFALVRANAAGGKTDAYIRQNVEFQSTITEDGQIMDKLQVSRSFAPPANAPWWNKVKNQTHLMVFAPQNAALIGADGGTPDPIHPRLNYAKAGYAIDSDLAALESTAQAASAAPQVTIFSESRKTVFGAWSVLSSGGTDHLELDYSSALPSPPAPGETFRFVMDKQPESTGSYHFRFIAPVGLHFAENHKAIYDFSTDDPDGRTEIELTFEKAQ